MQRFFSSSKNLLGEKFIISDKEQVHHIKNVLHLEKGEEVIVFDERAFEYRAAIEKLAPKEVVLGIKEKKQVSTAKKISLTIACAIPKKSKIDDIIDKLTQLGVDKIIPLETERVIVRLEKNKKISRQKRWEKIAVSAAEQSQRNILPVVDPVKEIEEVIKNSQSYDLKIIPTLIGERKTLKEVFSVAKPKNVLVLIGPEGDFTPAEVALATKNGFIPVTLGEQVLRVDTAAIAVASFIKLYEND